MRNYIEKQAHALQCSEIFPRLRQLNRSWLGRRGLLKLHLLDDHQLDDIGLTRCDLNRLTRLPLSVDSAWEAERMKIIAAHQHCKTLGRRAVTLQK